MYEYFSYILCVCVAAVHGGKAPPNVHFPSGPQSITNNGQNAVSWPSTDVTLGQVSGIDLDSFRNVHVFHRGPRVWNGQSFSAQGDFLAKVKGPIQEATLLTLDKRSGRILNERGANRFYMPHGLTVDGSDNVWVTDVALHQVMKFTPGSDRPSLVLGEAFKRGNDEKHFCQPTDVAVSDNTGDFFVSDGYCNSRIIKFSPTGRYITSWGHPNKGHQFPQPVGSFWVPHSITLVEDWDLLCAADRENQRVQCFSAGTDPRGSIPTGTFIKKAEDLGRVYAIDSQNHYLVGVTNRGVNGESPRLFVVDMESGTSEVAEPNLENPHDVVADVDRNGNLKTIYVAEIGPHNTIKKIDL